MSGPETTNRIDYMDRLRGLAVVAMFFVHSAGALLAPWARQGDYWQWSMRISGMVAPIFMFLVGISIALMAFRGRQRDKDESALRRRIALRGVKIVGLGYGLHAVFWLLGNYTGQWEKVLKVDILHCIGLSMAVFTLLAWPRGKINGRALALFVIVPVLGQISFRLSLEEVLPTALAGYLSTTPANTLFPFIPYGTWVAMGLFVGPVFARMVDGRLSEKRFWIGILVLALMLYALGKGIRSVYYEFDLQHLGGAEVPQKGLVHLFFAKAAVVLVVFFVMRATNSLFDSDRFQPLLLFGKTSLFAYCVHLLVIYNLTGPFFRYRLSPLEHVVYTLMLTVAMYLLSVAWRRWYPVIRHAVIRPTLWKADSKQTKLG